MINRFAFYEMNSELQIANIKFSPLSHAHLPVFLCVCVYSDFVLLLALIE